MKVQYLNFSMPNNTTDEVYQSLKVDNGYKILDKISFVNVEYFPIPAAIQVLDIAGDSSIIEKGTEIGHFQNLSSNEGLKLDYVFKQDTPTIKVALKNTSQPNNNYTIQIAFFLKKN